MHRCVPRARELPRVEAVRPPLPAPVTKKAVTKIPVTENRVTKKPRGPAAQGASADGGGADAPLALPRVGRWHVLKLPAQPPTLLARADEVIE